MSNMLFKTNRNLFVRYYDFNLPRKVDSCKEIISIVSLISFKFSFQFSKNGFKYFSPAAFFLLLLNLPLWQYPHQINSRRFCSTQFFQNSLNKFKSYLAFQTPNQVVKKWKPQKNTSSLLFYISFSFRTPWF